MLDANLMLKVCPQIYSVQLNENLRRAIVIL